MSAPWSLASFPWFRWRRNPWLPRLSVLPRSKSTPRNPNQVPARVGERNQVSAREGERSVAAARCSDPVKRSRCRLSPHRGRGCVSNRSRSPSGRGQSRLASSPSTLSVETRRQSLRQTLDLRSLRGPPPRSSRPGSGPRRPSSTRPVELHRPPRPLREHGRPIPVAELHVRSPVLDQEQLQALQLLKTRS